MSTYRLEPVLARRWSGPFDIEKLVAQQTNRFTELLREREIDYFIARSDHTYHHSVAVLEDDRTEVLSILASCYSLRGAYVKTSNGYRPLSPFRLRRLRRAPVIRLGEYVTGDRGPTVVGPAHGLTVEFWQEGERFLESPGHEERLARLRVVAPEHILRKSLIAPQPNPVSEVIPGRAREAAEVRIGDQDHPTLAAFTWELATDLTFPVDAVYTWVDGSDEAWRAKRDSHLGESAPANPHSASDSRYTSRDELLYSLRSLEMFAPFVRNVYIVTDGQTPPWLDTSHPRVRVVDHKEIFSDPSVLPVFNSHAIESQLHHIEGLSEHYLYLNDDVFFGRPVSSSHFFHPNGTVKLNPSLYRFGLGEASEEDQPVDAAAKRNSALLEKYFGRVPVSKFKHTPIPQRRSVLHELEKEFPEVFARTAASRFRHPDDHSVPSSLHNYYALFTGRAVVGGMRYTYLNLADFDAVRSRTETLLSQRNFDTFCVNDTADPKESAERRVDEFLGDYFPFKSGFER
ncbi:stealth family protein [Nocardiopsis quinghaiensis]|uniref:stealth family protein n=1 Tax=Nocardiopsis quinghaiensis TaxID=464995 RepID=UPI001CC24320|nr:stealth family protein [Nocardiopsis quinghaiensis]